MWEEYYRSYPCTTHFDGYELLVEVEYPVVA